MASGVRKEPRLTAGKNTSKTVTEKPAARIESKNKRLSKDSSEQSQTTPADEKGKTISESAKNVCILKESDPDGDGNMKDFDLKGQKEVEMKKSEKADDIVVTDDADLEPLTTLDIHKEHYQKLPISWDGAPNFNWKSEFFFPFFFFEERDIINCMCCKLTQICLTSYQETLLNSFFKLK